MPIFRPQDPYFGSHFGFLEYKEATLNFENYFIIIPELNNTCKTPICMRKTYLQTSLYETMKNQYFGGHLGFWGIRKPFWSLKVISLSSLGLKTYNQTPISSKTAINIFQQIYAHIMPKVPILGTLGSFLDFPPAATHIYVKFRSRIHLQYKVNTISQLGPAMCKTKGQRRGEK